MQSKTRTHYSILNIMTGLGGFVINTLLGFVCRIVFVRCLSADYLGVNGLFTNILSMLSLAELGVGSAIVFALYKPLAENDEEKIASLMQLYSKAYRSIGTIIAAVGLLLMPFIGLIIKEQPDIAESIYLLYAINLFNTASSYFFSYRTSLLIAAQRNYIVSGVSYIITILQSGVQMIFLLAFKNYVGYLLIQTAGTLIYNLTVSRIAVKQFPFIADKNVKPLEKAEKRRLFANVRDLMFYKLSGALVNCTDNILITFFNGLTTTGIASNYTLLVNTLSSILNQVFGGLTASIGNHNASEDSEKQYEMFSFLNMMNFWFFGWAALGILFCSSDLVRLFFGESYVLPTEIPFIMALNFYTFGVVSVIGTYKDTLGLFHYGRYLQLITGMLNIVLSIILGKLWGVFGIFAATVISRMCTHLWYTPYAVFRYGFKKSVGLYWKRYVGYLLLLCMAGGVCRFVFGFITGYGIGPALLKILVCSIVANAVFVIGLNKTAEYAKLKTCVASAFKRLFKKA